MKTLMNTLMTCAVLGMMCTSAFAGGGGGGAKGDVTTTVVNDTDKSANPAVMVVGVGPLPASITQFLKEGAQFVPPGGSATFSTPPGTITISAIFIQDAGGFANSAAGTSVAGGTTVTAQGDVTVPSITF